MDEWFINQLWIKPRSLDFGNIITDRTLSLQIFSTYRPGTGRRSLNAVDTAALGVIGVTMDPATVLPLPFEFMQSRTISYTADSTGVPSFNTNISFGFDIIDFLVQYLGTRLVLLPYVPEVPVQEQLSWVTDIMKSRSGEEQRHSLRAAPRQQINYNYNLDNDVDKAKLRHQLLGLQPYLFGLPEWWDQRVVLVAMTIGQTLVQFDKNDADFSDGGAVMILKPDGTNIDAVITTVVSNGANLSQGVASAVPLGSVIVPLRFAYVTRDPRFSDAYLEVLETEVQFETTDTRDIPYSDAELTASIFTRHPLDGLPVLTDPNMMSNRHPGSQAFLISDVDGRIGARVQYPRELIGKVQRPKQALAETAAKVWAWRRLLHYLRGSWRAFYLPTFRNDLPVNVSWNISSSSFLCRDVGLAAAALGTTKPYTDVYIKLLDGRTYVRRVTSAADNLDGTFTITLNSAPQGGSEVILAANVIISWAVLSRVDGDVATITHQRPGLAVIQFNTVAVQQ